MAPERDASARATRVERASEEARVMLEQAQSAWQRQVASEEAFAPSVRVMRLRFLLLAVGAVAVVYLLFAQLV